MATAAVSASPPGPVAITRKLPVAVPAVYRPAPLTAPPVAVQVTATGVEAPLDSSPAAASCTVPPGATVALAGVTTTAASTGFCDGTVTKTDAVSAMPPAAVAIT